MPGMEPAYEGETPPTEHPAPVSANAEGLENNSRAQLPNPPALAADAILLAIAANDGPWFPSRHAAANNLPRNSLDDPLAQLRLAGWIRVSDWVKDVGQGYVLTPEGEAAAANPALREQLKQPPQTSQPGAVAAEGDGDSSANPEPPPSETGSESNEPNVLELSIRPPLVVPILLMVNALWFFVCAVWSIDWGLTPMRLALGTPREGVGTWRSGLRERSPQRRMVAADHSLFRAHRCLAPDRQSFRAGDDGAAGGVIVGPPAISGDLLDLRAGRQRAGDGAAAGGDARRRSGVIWGVQMSLFVWLFAFRHGLPPDLASDWLRRLCVIFVLNAGLSFLPSVDLGGAPRRWSRRPPRGGAADRRSRWRSAAPDRAWILLGLLPVICVGGLVLAMDATRPSAWQRFRLHLAAEEGSARNGRAEQAISRSRSGVQHPGRPPAGALEPARVNGVELNAGELVMRNKRSPERVKAMQTRIAALKADAEAVVQYTTRNPIGNERFDHLRERVRAFAAARVKSFDLMLAMLAAPEPPKNDAWEVWRAARRDADRLWSQITLK